MGANKDFYRSAVDSVQGKLAKLAQDSRIRSALPDEGIEEISRAIESERIEDLHGRFYPPLFLLVRKLDLSLILELESDIELVLSSTDPTKKDDALLFLRELRDDRTFRAGLFEIFAKSRLLRAGSASAELDVRIHGCSGCNADARLSFGGREFYLECTVLSESNEDRTRLQELITAKKTDPCASQWWMSNLPYDAGRLYEKVYDKLAREWNPEKSQLSDTHPNALLISLFGRGTSVSPASLGIRLALEELFSERIGKPEEERAVPPDNTSLRGWLHYKTCVQIRAGRSAPPMAEAEYKIRYLELLNSRKKISAILLFQDCELRESRVNYSATHRITHGEMARLEELFKPAPRWT